MKKKFIRKKNNLIKISGWLFIFSINFPIIIILFICLFEYSNLAKKIIKAKYNIDQKIVRGLENTDYYQNKNFGDPYEFINNLSLHPHYFSQSSQSNPKNYSIVKVNSEGFRINFDNKNNLKKGVFLGGSVAFGHGATSNFKTIPSYLTKYTNYNFVNLGQPIWNSTQELTALIRYNPKYNLSISFSLSNDIHSFCVNKKNSLLTDSPEIFNFINRLYLNHSENFLNELYVKENYNSLKNSFKNIFFNIFPDTYNFFQIRKRINTDIYNPFQQTIVAQDCIKNFDDLKKSIINNQYKMYEISKLRGAKHIFIIQPFLHLHRDYSFLSNEVFLKNEKKLIKEILSSELCGIIECVDLTDFFDQFNKLKLVYDPGYKFCYNKCFKDSSKKLFNTKNRGDSFKENFFIDNYHLTDTGNELVAKEIKKYFN
jgi:hypothetical protein